MQNHLPVRAHLPWAPMRRSLHLHPDCRCEAVESLEAEVMRSSAAGLAVHFIVTGDLRGLQLPLPSAPTRADELWRHTCFELFLRGVGQDAYYEFNFSPSLQWAAYRFDSYRKGMRPLEIPAPRIEMRQEARTFELQAALHLEGIFDKATEWRFGLSAVIETNDKLSYWALAHPPGKPDFHHARTFALRLPAAGTATGESEAATAADC